MPVLNFRILGPKRNLNHRPFFSIGQIVNELIRIILLIIEVHLNSGATIIGIVLCLSHQACCLLYYLGEIINSGISHSHIPVYL